MAQRARVGADQVPRRVPGRAADRSRIGDTVYADDTTLLSSSWETAKAQWHRYIDVVGQFGLTIAFPKTKAMVSGQDDSGGMLLLLRHGSGAVSFLHSLLGFFFFFFLGRRKRRKMTQV